MRCDRDGAVAAQAFTQSDYGCQPCKSDDWTYDHATVVATRNVLPAGQPLLRCTANVFGISVACTGR